MSNDLSVYAPNVNINAETLSLLVAVSFLSTDGLDLSQVNVDALVSKLAALLDAIENKIRALRGSTGE
jgi:hypothetical protein